MLALAGYLLLAPPVFVFGPLAGLLLLSRPATAREWLWLLAGGAWSALWLQQVGGVGAQVTRAAAVLLCGAFLALTLWQPSNAVGRAVAATATAGAVLGLLDVAARHRVVAAGVRGEPGAVDLRDRDARSVAEGRGTARS